MPLPLITFQGNVTADPELRFTQAGKAVVGFTVACNSSKKDDQGNWVDGDSCFIRCTAWDQMAENIAETLIKGAAVVGSGQLLQREYTTREGEARTSLECKLYSIGPNLKNATATIRKAQWAVGAATAPAPAEDPWASPATASEPPF